jgi:hypothetical protein
MVQRLLARRSRPLLPGFCIAVRLTNEMAKVPMSQWQLNIDARQADSTGVCRLPVSGMCTVLPRCLPVCGSGP